MAKLNLDKLDIKELRQLQRDVAKAIESYEQRTKAKALPELDEVASKHGFKLQELVGAKPSRSIESRYRHPENPDLVWARPPAALDLGRFEGRKGTGGFRHLSDDGAVYSCGPMFQSRARPLFLCRQTVGV